MLGNWIKQSVSSGGTGNLTVAAVTGFDVFYNQFGDGTTNTPYRLFDYVVQDGNDFEIGLGHMSATTTLVRDIIKAKLVSGTLTRYPATGLNVSTSAFVFCDLHSDSEDAPGVYNIATYGVPFKRTGTSTASVTMSTNYFIAWPVFNRRSMLAKGIRTHCTTAGGGTKWQMGLYQPAKDGTIGNLLARTGDVTPATGDATQLFNASATVYIEKGWYWLAWSGDCAPVYTAQNIYGGVEYGLGVGASGTPLLAAYVSSLQNPLPATAPGSLTYSDSTSVDRPPNCELVPA